MINVVHNQDIVPATVQDIGHHQGGENDDEDDGKDDAVSLVHHTIGEGGLAVEHFITSRVGLGRHKCPS